MLAQIDDMIARMKREREIHCPFCDALYDDSEERYCVSAWGEDPPKQAFCSSCERTFLVREIVTRTYETSKPVSTYAQLMREYRRIEGLTQTQMAARMGVTFATVNRWENGHFEVRPSVIAIVKERLQREGFI